MRKRSYHDILELKTFEERFEYLKLGGFVADVTFGGNRYLNQGFYASPEWKKLRHQIIIRDNGLDLGCEGFDISDKIFVHHMNPITVEDIYSGEALNPEYLICCSFDTHNKIHYGDDIYVYSARTPGDTKLW